MMLVSLSLHMHDCMALIVSHPHSLSPHLYSVSPLLAHTTPTGMIHESGVGVGISGKEGRHAANSADFAISQFSFLITLMFEHGKCDSIAVAAVTIE